jgi:hypothetical protein
VCSNSALPVYFNFIDGDKNIVGKISGLVIKRKGRQLYCYAGIALGEPDEAVYSKCMNALYCFARKNGFSRVEIKNFDTHFTSSLENSRKFIPTKFAEYAIFCHREPQYNKDFKTKLKKALKEPVFFKELVYNNETEEKFLSLMDNTLHHRVKNKHEAYNKFYTLNLTAESLKKLCSSGMGKIYAVESDVGIHCVHLHLEKGGKAYSLLLGCDDYSYKKGLRAFLDHNLTEMFRERKFEYYNLGVIPMGADGEGLLHYKKSTGAIPTSVCGAYTPFLTFPYNLLNPVYRAGRLLAKYTNVVLNRTTY